MTWSLLFLLVFTNVCSFLMGHSFGKLSEIKRVKKELEEERSSFEKKRRPQ